LSYREKYHLVFEVSTVSRLLKNSRTPDDPQGIARYVSLSDFTLNSTRNGLSSGAAGGFGWADNREVNNTIPGMIRITILNIQIWFLETKVEKYDIGFCTIIINPAFI